MGKRLAGQEVSTIGASADVDVLELELNADYSILHLSMTNESGAGAEALEGFSFQAKSGPNGEYVEMESTWASASGLIKKLVGSPEDLATGATAWITIDVSGLEAVKFVAADLTANDTILTVDYNCV